MAKIIYDFNEIKRNFNVYEKSQAKFAGKRALTRLSREIKGRNGLVAKTYLGKDPKFTAFKSAVPFTLSSTYGIQQGLNLTVGVKDEKAITKGNPASKYLYPPIGGGSTKAYDTLFTQYLKNRNFMNKGDYPFAVTGNRLIKLNKKGRVTKATYSNTMIGLAKTRDKDVKPRSLSNAKIQDARVIAFKRDTGKYRKGIYREQTPSTGKYKSFLRPLFMFKPIPTQPPQATFYRRVKSIADDRVFKYWTEEIKQLAK